MIPDHNTWDIGEKVKFDASSFDWYSWIGTLRTCEFPQVAVFDCVVRIHYIEVTQGKQVIAYGVVVSHQTMAIVKQAIKQKAQFEQELELSPDTVIDVGSVQIEWKEGAKERLVEEREERRKKEKHDYQSMIRSNIRGFRK